MSHSGEKKPPRTSTGSIPAQVIPGADRNLDLRTDASILTNHQRSLLGSGFGDSAAAQKRNTALGVTVPGAQKIPKEAEKAPVDLKQFDGKTVPDALKARDVWKALQAAVTSRPGKRSKELLLAVVNQFGMMVNPRYDEDAPGKGRGHIFVWDVSRAMECEIPHFAGAKELSLAQTCDWVRHEGPMRGWKRAGDPFEIAAAGCLVIALPRDARTKFIALVLPQEYPSDNSPLLYGIGLKRDVAVHPRDMFGAKAVDCFYHD
ncbi:MAG: hypothetical protein QM817_07065 [Archangium sp.]